MNDSPSQDTILSGLANDGFLRLCAVFVVVMVLMPPDGISGLDCCMWKRATNAPCPGCGMTRCGANMVRGQIARALNYHPFGVVIVPTILALGALALAPRRWRDGSRQFLVRWNFSAKLVFWTVTGAFLVFGMVRWALVACGLVHFPADWF